MRNPQGGPPASNLATSPEQLNRDDLIRLVHDLRAIVSTQKETIARQGAAIATLQNRRPQPDPDSAATAPTTPAAAVNSRQAAQTVSGFDYTIVFDGGAIGNPGRGYGSYQIVGPDGLVARERRDYGDRVTNNQAEYRTLIEALEDLRDRLGRSSARSSVAIRGDSQLVVEQVNGRWKVKHPDLLPLHRHVVELLAGFGRSRVAWHRRDASVRLLGH